MRTNDGIFARTLWLARRLPRLARWLPRFAVPQSLFFALFGGLIAASFSAPASAQLTAQIQLVGYAKSSLSSSAATSYSITVPTGVETGDFLLAVTSNNPGTGGAGPSGWTYITSNITTSNSVGYSLWYRFATSADVAGSTAYTWTVTTSSIVGGVISAFRGVDPSNPVVTYGTSANSTASTSRTAPSLTPGMTNTTLVALYAAANGNSDTPTAPTGMAQIFAAGDSDGTSGVFLSAFYESLAPATASPTLVSTGSISTTSVGGSVALKAATLSPTALWHLDEASWNGTAGEVVDSGGSGYGGQAMNGATTGDVTPAIAGSPGTCYYGTFSGSSQYVELPSSLPHPGTTFSVTAWIYPTSTSIGRIFSDDQQKNGWAVSYGDPGAGLVRFFKRQPTQVTNDTTSALSLNTWYFVVAIMDAVTAKTMTLLIYNTSGNLVTSASTAITGFSAGTGSNQAIANTVTEDSYFFPGRIDEVIIYPGALTTAQAQSLVLATHPCATYNAANHYAVSTPGTAVNCAPAAVSITAHSSTHAAVATTATISITTSTGHGDWTLTSGSGTFAAGGSDSGSASYTYVAADAGVVVLALRDTHAETVTINVTDGNATATSGTATAAEDSPLTFAASGFITTNASNVATAIGTQRAGVTSTQSLALQAVRTDTSTGACTTVFASGSTVNVSLAYQCKNPTSCVAGQSLSLTNNGTSTSLASNPNSSVSSYTTVPLKFTTANGEAPITLNYSDAGQISLLAKYNIPLGNGNPSGSIMTGSSTFVVQPYTLVLSNIKVTSSGTANPAASTASGSVFTAAGQAFTTTVTAKNYQGNATPNFGQETSPASVTLTPALILPTSGDNPAVSGSLGAYSSGVATGTAFSWPEVGIITLTPTVASYLGSGTVTGTTSGNVGRFIPASFATAVNTPVFGTACSAGSFSYVGQPFTYTAPPVITTTALTVGGTTAKNYTGSLMRLTNSSLTNRTYTPTPASPALTLTGLPATSADPVIVDSGAGQSTLTFSAGSGISFTRGSAIAPFTANVALSINVIDADGVTAANPVTFGASGGISFSTGANQYYGRLFLRDSVGSELLDLPMPLTTQYYLSTTQGFVTNTSDVCTVAPAITFSNYQTPLASGETCVRDTGSPGASGQGCAAAASSPYAGSSGKASAGAYNLVLAAPGSPNTGALTVTATAPSWLQYPWNNASCGSTTNPCALGTFGLFPGSATRVYQRETY